MKRAITTSVVAGLLGTLGFAPAVSAEGTLYGSLRTGVIMTNPEGDGDSTWDIGNTEDTLGSRIGVKASLPLDGGMSVGVHIEKKLGTWGTRLQNASLSGGFGSLTVGQQWGTFYNATSIDGAYFFGGNTDGDTGYRSSGIQYSSNLGGPFSFSAMVKDNGGDSAGDGADIMELSGTLNVAGANLSVGWQDVDEGTESIRARVSGSFGPLGYKVGGGTIEAASGSDTDVFGAFVSYSVMDGGSLYLEYEDIDSDDNAADNNYLLVGYAHTVAPGFTVIGEFTTPDTGTDKGALVLKVDF